MPEWRCGGGGGGERVGHWCICKLHKLGEFYIFVRKVRRSYFNCYKSEKYSTADVKNWTDTKVEFFMISQQHKKGNITNFVLAMPFKI